MLADDPIVSLLSLFGQLVWLALLIVVVAIGVRLGMRWSRRDEIREREFPEVAAYLRDNQPAGPKEAAALAVPITINRYAITGVDKASKMDTHWTVTAESEANARAKAELEGIIVTSVELIA